MFVVQRQESRREENAMKEFIAKFGDQISGVLSGFDRLVFRGHLRGISYVTPCYPDDRDAWSPNVWEGHSNWFYSLRPQHMHEILRNLQTGSLVLDLGCAEGSF